MKDNYYSGHGHPGHDGHMDPEHCAPKKVDRGVKSKQMNLLPDEETPLVGFNQNFAYFKIPVILAERDLQIVVESDISLYPPATEIKQVKKHVFLDQVKLVPVRFARIANTDFFTVTRAKLFVMGHIRKNIQYASKEYNAPLQDRIAKVKFSGFAELSGDDFYNAPIIGISESAEANFVSEKTQTDARLDKYFFQNLVKYNEQPYGELVAANFFELDYAPHSKYHDGSYSSIREKIVLDLTLKLLQKQQIFLPGVTAQSDVPNLFGLTPPAVSGELGPREAKDTDTQAPDKEC